MPWPTDPEDEHMSDITFVRIQRYDTPDLHTYAAVRRDDLAAVLAASDRVETVQEWDPALPAEIIAALAAQLAAPVRPVRAVIGDVTGDTWVSGPLKGQRRPRFWVPGHPPLMANGYRCKRTGDDGYRCCMYGEGLQNCLAHQPGTRWETWEPLPPLDDDQDDDEA
jgi:hypothetical protein